MDPVIAEKHRANSLAFKAALSRIAEKYSKLRYVDEGEDLDLTDMKELDRCLKMSKQKMKQLDSKSLRELREQSQRTQNITKDSKLNFTHQEDEADVSSISNISSIHPSVVDVDSSGMNRSDMSQLSVNSLEETRTNLCEMGLQPEDQDEELEQTLNSQSSGRSSLVDCYAHMVSRVGRAYHLQQVSEAADSVLRRYRRWRQHPNRSFVNDTLNATIRGTSRKLKKTLGKTLQRDCTETRQFMVSDATPRSPLHTLAKLKERQAEQGKSPRLGRGSVKKENKPILVIDLSGPSEAFKPKVSLNETFTVSQLSSPERATSSYAASPSRAYYPVAFVPSSPGIGSSCISFSPRSGGSVHVKERGDINSSPIRLSPFKQRVLTEPSKSPSSFPRSPRAHPVRHRSMSMSLSLSPEEMPAGPSRMFFPQDSHQPIRSQPSSPQLLPAAGRQKLRRHLSFDSSLPNTRAYYSPKKIDEDFVKVYHKYICQNKSSPFHRAPCRYCGRSSESSRSSLSFSPSSSSSALAALALSPHRPLLRGENQLQWKRSRDEYCPSSPGSKRQKMERLRHCLSPSLMKWSHGGPPYSPRKHSICQRPSSQQHPPYSHQVALMIHHRPTAEYPGQGGSVEGRMRNHFSPKKRW